MSKDFVIGPVDSDLLESNGFTSFERVDISTMEELGVLAGIFPSKGQAKKNGFIGPIPTGINLLGSKKTKVWVWNHPNPSKKEWRRFHIREFFWRNKLAIKNFSFQKKLKSIFSRVQFKLKSFFRVFRHKILETKKIWFQ